MRRDTEKSTSKEGSLSVEAALVIPIFLFGMICIISLHALLLFQMRLKEAMCEVVKKGVESSIENDHPSVNIMGNNINDMIGDDMLRLAPINGEINYYSENYGDEIICICAEYEAKLYFDMFNLFHHHFVQKCAQHDFSGYGKGFLNNPVIKEDVQIVYVTNESEVYHINRECTHIRLKISIIESDDLKNARNSSGARYKSCEHCNSKKSDRKLYITPDGDKYHNSLSCSGLKRTVIAIPITEAEGKRCCSRCGR